MPASKRTKEDQVGEFKRTARALECDESEAAFDKALGVIGRAKPPPKAEPKNKKKRLRG
jgi:hypothetical protein